MTEDDARILALLEELVTWTRFANRANFIESLEAELKDDKQLLAYELTDGRRGQKQVGDAVGLSQPTISGLWKRWRRLGIVREVQGRLSILLVQATWVWSASKGFLPPTPS